MSTEQQLVSTRSHRMPTTSSHISKAARQMVPAFLQKLYEMVNDPNNAELIRWSETGDSFFVLDHERFAHEVLGRWFKHRNFSSFVRQLNMYGFHKIPHLQQGVLKSDSDTEFWNFAHANFHRGQGDLLCLIQRKKQTAQQGDEPTIELRDTTNNVGLIGPPNAPAGGTAPALPNGQVLDIHSIVSGISAIKRHQTTISAELNELKHSNQLLWQDALATRTRHQKQQDTINRIVKFLAGVFGTHPAAGAGVAVPGTQTVDGQENHDGIDAATNHSRKRMRLMIEDAKRDGPTKSMVEELTEIPADLDAIMQFETPTPDGFSFPLNPENQTLNGQSIVPPQQTKSPSATKKQQEEEGKQTSRAVTPSRSPTIAFDPQLHNMINHLSQSQIQLLLSTISSQTNADPPPPPPAETINPNATNSLTQYQPHFDLSQPNALPNHLSPIDHLISFDNYDPQLPEDSIQSLLHSDHEQRMEKQWRAAEDIDKDVSAIDSSINTSINSLIQTFGLDPTLFDGEHQNQHETNGTADQIDSQGPTVALDFDIDAFLNSLPNGSNSPGPSEHLDASNMGDGTIGMDYDGLGSDFTGATFLDEVHTPTASEDMIASPVQPLRQVSSEMTLNGTSDAGSSPAANLNTNGSGVAALNPGTPEKAAGGNKRKSDAIADNDAALADETKGAKVKRRK